MGDLDDVEELLKRGRELLELVRQATDGLGETIEAVDAALKAGKKAG